MNLQTPQVRYGAECIPKILLDGLHNCGCGRPAKNLRYIRHRIELDEEFGGSLPSPNNAPGEPSSQGTRAPANSLSTSSDRFDALEARLDNLESLFRYL